MEIFLSKDFVEKHVAGRPEGYWQEIKGSVVEELGTGYIFNVGHPNFLAAIQKYGHLPRSQANASQAALALTFHRLWDRLHRCAFLTLDVLSEVRGQLPCGECRKHFDAYVAANPPPLGRPVESFLWTVDFHDAVNVLKGKPRFGRLAAAGKYGIELPSMAS